jgi:hypothetical protein
LRGPSVILTIKNAKTTGSTARFQLNQHMVNAAFTVATTHMQARNVHTITLRLLMSQLFLDHNLARRVHCDGC